MSEPRFDQPRLIADVGGTYARFALEVAPHVFEQVQSLRCADFADFHAAVTGYLNALQGVRPDSVRHAAIAIANPVAGDDVRMTNYHWQFSIEQMRQRLGLDNLVVVNDFTALAMAVPGLAVSQRRQFGGGQALARSVIGLIGAGTGLGVSGLIPANDGWVALGTEGGHSSFAPHDERELAILRFAWRQYDHVSFERLASGPGIALIYLALAEYAGVSVAPLDAPEITRRALAGEDALCQEAIDTFCAILGTAAGNLAVTQGALGGIYIGGGIVPRLGAYFDASPFRARFEDKGRFADYMRRIPTFVITAQDATLQGASAILAAQLRGLEGGEGSATLAQIKRALPNLSPAEQRVANHVLSQPRSVLNDPIAQIARLADVSQPTVIRFCRSMGCEGLSDFKLRLASSLTGTMPITHTQVTQQDSMLELGAKVLGNTASAILQTRDHLNRDSMDRAMRLIASASRVEVYAVGHYGAVAQDAQFKLLRVGVAAAAYTDTRLQILAAQQLRSDVVVLIISGSGRIAELLDVAEAAQARGATVVAITESQSPLARKANLSLIVDHVEDIATQVPMISRILYLLMVDILVVGVALQRGAAMPSIGSDATARLDESQPGNAPVQARRKAPGVSAAGELAHLAAPNRSV